MHGVSTVPTKSLARFLRPIIRVIAVLGSLGYPLAIYYGLMHWNTRVVALAIAAIFLFLITTRFGAAAEAVAWHEYGPATAMLGLAAGAYFFDDRRILLALPVVINGLFLIVFWGSLRGKSIVERMARRQVVDLGPAEVKYCRRVTIVWCSFFAVNALTAGLLALFGPFEWWAVYTGLFSYVLIALLFAVEYAVRLYRFPRARRGVWLFGVRDYG